METLKEIIDQKEIEILSTKYLNDQQLIELVGFMIQKQSIINSLSLKEGSLTKTGISYLSKNYNFFEINKFFTQYSKFSRRESL